MISATELRPGMVVIHNGELHRAHSVVHKTPGNLRGFVQAKLRNLKSGAMNEHRFRSEDRIEKASLDTHEMQYLYSDSGGHHFMNQETYDQIHVSADIIGDYAVYLQEGMVVNLSTHEGVPVSIEIPQKVTLEIVDTEPVVKGQTASGSFKPAKLSNGVRTMVPTHITVGTRVVVNTADGSYVERAKD